MPDVSWKEMAMQANVVKTVFVRVVRVSGGAHDDASVLKGVANSRDPKPG